MHCNLAMLGRVEGEEDPVEVVRRYTDFMEILSCQENWLRILLATEFVSRILRSRITFIR